MKNFYTFLKRKGLHVPSVDTIESNDTAVMLFNHELIALGYIMNGDLFKALSVRDITFITELRNEILTELDKFSPKKGGTIVYRTFPNHDADLSTFNGILSFFNSNNIDDLSGDHIVTSYGYEPAKLKVLDLVSLESFESIFTDIIYSGESISKLDKDIINYFIENGYSFDFSKISFNETKAYIGKRFLEDETLTILPIKSATTLLRVYANYCGGDEGLKNNTYFKNPSARLVRLLSTTLENCYDLEESFKTYREVWLRLLFYLNPLTKKNKNKNPNLYNYTRLLRNEPKKLKTFNSYVEEGFNNKDKNVLDLLKKRPSAFSRKLDHAVRVFGLSAMTAYLDSNVKFRNLVDNYNHFTTRDKESERTAVLANSNVSKVVNYEALKPLKASLVKDIKEKLLKKIESTNTSPLKNKKVFIDDTLYYRNLVSNNRASNTSLSSNNGETEYIENNINTLRLFVEWYSSDDIDMSGLVIYNDGSHDKIGFAGSMSHSRLQYIKYSGDNTGKSNVLNQEFIDINVKNIPSNVEWIVIESRVFRGSNFNNFKGGNPKMGWMKLEKASKNEIVSANSVGNSSIITSDSANVIMLAYNAKENAIVYLDIATSDNNVTSDNDVAKVATYINNIASFKGDNNEIKWDKINQGHVLYLLSKEVVDKPEDADIIFNKNTTSEEISKYF